MEGRPDFSWETRMLQAARAGDLEALGQLLEKYRPYLMAVARRVLADQPPGEWSSVVQAGTATALERWQQFRGLTPGEMLNWLAAVVRNRALDRRRKRPVASRPIAASPEFLPAATATPSESGATGPTVGSPPCGAHEFEGRFGW